MVSKMSASRPTVDEPERNVHAVCTKLGVFGVGRSNGVLQIYPRPTLVAMAAVNQSLLFEQKSGYNSAYTGDMSSILAQNRGFSGSANLTVLVKFVPDRPRVP